MMMYKILAQINKILLPSFSKQSLDLAKAKKWQMAIIGYRYYVTTRALDCWFKVFESNFFINKKNDYFLTLGLQEWDICLYLHSQKRPCGATE